jgi:hypothetical protein
MAIETRFSFLTAGPAFRLKLPDDFDALPDLSSPLTIKDGAGRRSFDFVAHTRDRGIDEAHRVLGTLTGREGRTVQLYERLDSPRQWYLRWILSSGALYTHLREEDGVDRAEPIAAGLGIVENGGTPFLLLERPLGRGVLNHPGYQELAIYWSTSRRWVVELQRPGYLAKGKVMRLPDRERAMHRAGASFGIEVTVHSGADVEGGRQLTDAVVNSLAEG